MVSTLLMKEIGFKVDFSNSAKREEPNCLALMLQSVRIAVVYMILIFGSWIAIAIIIIIPLTLLNIDGGICLIIGLVLSFLIIKLGIFLGVLKLIPRSWTHGNENTS